MIPTPAEEAAVLASVTYASLFDYPLTLGQLQETLGVPAGEDDIAHWLTVSPLLAASLDHRGGFIYPAGRHELPGIRRRREAANLPRLRGDQPALAFVAGLPWVRMVAISGSLAHLNADDTDASADLDLFVITAPGRVWLVTVVALVVAKLRGWRRRLCLNYVISDAALAVGPGDLFTANQIVHLQPLCGADVYARFLTANPFVAAHYPNFVPRAVSRPDAEERPWRARLIEAVAAPIAPLLERIARGLYGWHLRRRSAGWASRDGVRLESECLKLHTSSHREAVMTRFSAALDTMRQQSVLPPSPARSVPAGARPEVPAAAVSRLRHA